MLWVVTAATIPSANSQSRVDLEPRRSIGIQQFQRSGAFPVTTIIISVGVDPRGRVKQMGQIRRD